MQSDYVILISLGALLILCPLIKSLMERIGVPALVVYHVNPLTFWLACLMTFQMGAATLIARKILKSRGQREKVFSISPLIAILVGIALVIAAYAWGKGENLYVIFLEGYRFFFGAGV